MRKYLIFFYLLLAGGTVFSQNTREDSLFHQQYYLPPSAQLKGHSGSDTSINWLVKLAPGVDAARFSAPGVRVLRRLSERVFIIALQPSAAATLSSFFLYRQPANDQWKLAPALPGAAVSTTVTRSIYHIHSTDTAAFNAFLQAHSAAVQLLGAWPAAGLFRIAAADSFFYHQLVPLPYVQFADKGDKKPSAELAVLDFNDSFSGINAVHARYPTLHADGLTVSVKEDLFDTTDIDLRQRIIPYAGSSKQTAAHATTMATLIGGAGNTYYTGRGVTDACSFSSSSYAVLLPDTGSYYKQIHVQNHSYGVGIENYYGAEAAAYDAGMIADTGLVHVFSAGNSGNLADTAGRYKNLAGFANLTGNFKMAKNIITVGSLDSMYTVPLLSSKGPAYDGRIKPELLAYGQGGSSGAAALTSGTVLLLQDAYRQQYNGNRPASALIKALLINSAADIAPKGPDFSSGYGLLDAEQAVSNLLAGRFFRGSVQANQSSQFSITVPPNAVNLKITLVWNDPPAAPNALTALVNDLDLTVVHTSSGMRWQPWVLNSYPHTDSLLQAPTRKRDSLNTVEQVSIDVPAAGVYSLQVNGYRVSSGTQSFYIAYQWDTLSSFHWTSPARTDNFLAGSSNVFKWKAPAATGSGKLEISYDAGSHWTVIDAQVPLSAPYYRWNAPDSFVTGALARITTGNNVYTTDSFTISKQGYPLVGFNCGDSLLLHWPSTAGAGGYRLFNLKNKYLEPVADLKDSFVVLHHPDQGTPYYAVAPLDNKAVKGMNSYAIAFNAQGTGCYFNNFLADLSSSGQQALLTLQLGVLYNLQSLSFQKQTAAGWKTISSSSIDNSLTYLATDSTLTNGLNTYRAVLTNNRGQLIYSDPSSVYYWQNSDYILFPNPVPRGQLLQVLSKNPFNTTLCLYNMQGQKVWQQVLQNTLEQIPVNRLAKGVYIAVLLDKDQRKILSQKVVVE